MKVVLPVLLRVLWAAVVVVRAAPTPTPEEEALLRDVIPGFNEVSVRRAQPLSQIPAVVGTGKGFDLTRIFPDLAGVRSSSNPSYPILVLGSNSDISPAALSNFVRVSRQSLPHDSTVPEDVIGDGRASLEDNSVYNTGDDFDSREDSGDIVIPVPSSVGVPLIASEHSIATGSGTSTLITDEADLDLSSIAAGPTNFYVSPGTGDSTKAVAPGQSYDAPVSTSAPSVQYSAPKGLPQGLQLLLNRHADQMTDPSMTLGSFLQGLNGKNGVMVLPGSSLDAVQNAGVSVTVSDPSSPEFDITSVEVRDDIGDDGPDDDIHNSISRSDVVSVEDVDDLDLDLESREDDTLRIIVSSNPSTESSVPATTTTTTAATTTTTRRTVTTTTLSPTLFQGPLTELLYSKGQFFGTIIGSLLDLGTIIMTRIMNFKPF